jgi:Raf kinase inhibitor-like YbhB/YbcL family protein
MIQPGFWMAAASLLTLSAALPAQAQVPHTIIVESPTMAMGQPIPRDYTPDGRNLSPPITWRNLPAGTRQIAVVCEDFGAGNPPPWVHWIIYNIPATAGGLPEGLSIYMSEPMPPEIEGAVHGANGWGLQLWRGPAPPIGAYHNYNFVVYALDTELNLPRGLSRAELLERIEGHVLAMGELIPYYRRDPSRASNPSP